MFTKAAWESFSSKALIFAPQLVVAIVLLLIFWIAAILTKRVLERMERFRQLDPDLIDVLGGSAKVGVFGIGVVTALGTVGIDVTALVAGLGLTGFALGLALKDIISNAISGILVILYKPIKHKDFISVSGFQGQVVEINLRYTVLQGPDTTIFVPNSTLFSSGITVQREVEGGTAPEKDQ